MWCRVLVVQAVADAAHRWERARVPKRRLLEVPIELRCDFLERTKNGRSTGAGATGIAPITGARAANAAVRGASRKRKGFRWKA